MVYESIGSEAGEQLRPVLERLAEVDVRIEELSVAYRKEDSKSKEIQMRDEVKGLQKERRDLWAKQDQIETEIFKDLLAKEYGLPRNHPKFDKAFSLAYEHGHSSGYGDIENYFADFVGLVIEGK